MSLTFRRSLALALASIASLAIISVVVLGMSTERAFSSMRVALNQTMAVGISAQRIPGNVLSARYYEKNILLHISSSDQRNKDYAEWQAAAAKLTASIDAYGKLAKTPEQRVTVARWQTYQTAYTSTITSLVDAINKGILTTPSTANEYIATSNDPVQQLMAESQAEADNMAALTQQQVQEVEARLIRLRYTMSAVLGSLAVVMIILVMVLPNVLLRPIRLLTGAAQKVAAGDLTATVPNGRRDELGVLAMAFNTMLHGLQERQTALQEQNTHLQQMNERQQQLLATVAALSTPIIPLLDGMLLMPLVGHIDTQRADQVMQVALAAVNKQRARAMFVDISAVPVVDPAVMHALMQLAQALRLLGARVVFIGVRAEVAQTVATLGISGKLDTARDLEGGLALVSSGRDRLRETVAQARA